MDEGSVESTRSRWSRTAGRRCHRCDRSGRVRQRRRRSRTRYCCDRDRPFLARRRIAIRHGLRCVLSIRSLFGGLAGLLILSDPAISYQNELGYAIAIIAFTTSLIGFVARLARGPASPVSERRPARVVVTPNLARLGLILSFLGLLLLRLSSQLSPFADALAYSGVVLCMIAVFPAMRSKPKRSASHSLLAALSAVVALIIYLSSFFEGFGRLNLATLGLIAAALTGWVARRRYLKLFVVLAIGPFLILGASIGANRGYFGGAEQASAAAPPSFSESVSSVSSPTQTLGDVLRLNGSGQLSKRNAYGGTFITAAAAWVPRGYLAE